MTDYSLEQLTAKLARLDALEERFVEELEQAKLESLKQLAYGASHEVNNPLANISMQAQTLLKDETDPQKKRRLSAIHSQAYRAHEMIADLMLFARPPRLARQPLDLVSVVDAMIEELRPDAEERQIDLRCQKSTDSLMVSADHVQLPVALRAMCMNALEAIGLGGHVELSVRASSDRQGVAGGEIIVVDDGPGISPEVRENLFDPFYSGREAGRGLGFGLSKCWRIVTDHGGHIDVASGGERGATFTLFLPAA